MSIAPRQTEWSLLDHGHLKYIEHMGSDRRVVEAARNSTGKGFISWLPYFRCDSCGQTVINETWKSDEPPPAPCQNHKLVGFPRGDIGLLDFLFRKKHTTPFEFPTLTIEVQAPIMVFREWQRSRTASYNEFSARYAQMPDLHYLPLPERIQKQSAMAKQGSAESMDEDFAMTVIHQLEDQQHEVYRFYDAWVKEGLAKEVARLNTPASRYSKMWATTDVWNWLHFLNLRMRPNAQWEIRQYANALAELIKGLFPRTWDLFEEYDLYAVHLSRSEILALRDFLTEVFDAQGGTAKTILADFAQYRGLDKKKLAEFQEKLEFGGVKILE